jgi:hypothetical protein
MKHSAGISLDVMIYIPNFIKIGSGIEVVDTGGCTDIERARRSHKPAFIFSKSGKQANINS